MLAVFLALALQSPAAVRGDRGTVEWEGSVLNATPLPAGSGVVITLAPVDAVARPRTPPEIRVPFPEIPRAYTAVLNPTPQRLLPESIKGRIARVHAYIDERGTHVVAVETCEPHGSQTYRLDYVVPYFDLTGDRRTAHDYSLAAAVLSRHPEDVTRGTTIWVRDVIKKALFFYDRPDHAKDMIRRFGVAAMVDDIAAVQRVLTEHGDRTGLIRLRPFMPKDPGDRFVGWWGGFPVEIYRDAGPGPVRLFATRSMSPAMRVGATPKNRWNWRSSCLVSGYPTRRTLDWKKPHAIREVATAAAMASVSSRRDRGNL